MVLLKVLIIVCCGIMAFQDFKERAVTFILFPCLGLFLIILHLYNTSEELFLLAIIANGILISCILSILFIYTKYIAKKQFLNTSFGLGDLLFFYAFSLGFPTVTFVLLFVGSILFSLLVFLISKTGKELKTVPLAGLMGLFLIGVTLASFLPNSPSLYIL